MCYVPLSDSSEHSMVSVLVVGVDRSCSSFVEVLVSGLSLLRRILRSVGSEEESYPASSLQGNAAVVSLKLGKLSLTNDFETNSVNPSISVLLTQTAICK